MSEVLRHTQRPEITPGTDRPLPSAGAWYQAGEELSPAGYVGALKNGRPGLIVLLNALPGIGVERLVLRPEQPLTCGETLDILREDRPLVPGPRRAPLILIGEATVMRDGQLILMVPRSFPPPNAEGLFRFVLLPPDPVRHRPSAEILPRPQRLTH